MRKELQPVQKQSCNKVMVLYCRSMLILDPTDLEERVMEGKLVVGMNPYKEICVLHLAGSCSVDKKLITRCTEMAFTRVKTVAQMIKDALAEEAKKR